MPLLGETAAWVQRPMSEAPQDRRVLLVDRHGNFSAARWRALPGRDGDWVTFAKGSLVIVFEGPVAWYDLPAFVAPEDLR